MNSSKTLTGSAALFASLLLASPWLMAQTFKSDVPGKPPVAPGGIAQAAIAKCAPGFVKTQENKGPNGELNSFECKTPVLKCPKNPTHPALWLTANVDTHDAQNPDVAWVTLRYTCSYNSPAG